jgi:lysyl-tRNA synthetase class I
MEHEVTRSEYPVKYDETHVLNEETGDVECVSTDIHGGWNSEVEYKCECGKTFYSLEEASQHLRDQ